MASIPDLYNLLGVSRDASDEEIKRAYRRLARELHPDVNPEPGAEQRFKELTAAYETLRDPARRRQYDLFGTQGGMGPATNFPFGDFGDIFDVFFGGGLGGRRRGATRRRNRAMRGEDLFVELSLSFQEAAFGIQHEVEVETRLPCDRCQGTGCEPGTHPSRCTRCGGAGEVQEVARSIFGTVMTARTCPVCDGAGEEIASPCAQCRGEGRVGSRKTVTVEVPAGVADGMELRMSGEGHAGRYGGEIGDLYVSLRVAPHPIFERRGQDLVCALPVPMTQAALGAELEIPTLEDPERVKLEPGVESGTVLRLRGKGIPHLGRRGRGDLYVTVLVETPKNLSKEERAILERFGAARGEVAPKGQGLVGRLRKLIEQ